MEEKSEELITVAVFAAQGEANARMKLLAAQIDAICKAHAQPSTATGVCLLPNLAKTVATDLIREYTEWRQVSETVQKQLDSLRKGITKQSDE